VIADIAALATLLATGPVLAWAVDHPALIAAWSSVAGVMTGTAFTALLGRAAAEADGDERSAAAAIESADHLGAALGALVTGVIWVPVFGITATCLLFALLKLASLAGLILPRKGRLAPETIGN
jgi:predicted MFS family arabinose efflux permease